MHLRESDFLYFRDNLSDGYNVKDIQLFWDASFYTDLVIKDDYDVKWKGIVNDVITGKFVVTYVHLNETKTPEKLTRTNLHFGQKSYLSLEIGLQRAWRPYITRFYLPMALFVFVSLGTLFIHDGKIALIVNLFNVR